MDIWSLNAGNKKGATNPNASITRYNKILVSNGNSLVIKTEKKAYQRNDAHYLKSSMNAIKWIMEYGDRKIFFRSIKDNYPRKVSLSVIHNNCGVVSFARENTKPYFPHQKKNNLHLNFLILKIRLSG